MCMKLTWNYVSRKFWSRKQQKWSSMIFTPFYIPMIYVSCVALLLHPHTLPSPPPDDIRVEKMPAPPARTHWLSCHTLLNLMRIRIFLYVVLGLKSVETGKGRENLEKGFSMDEKSIEDVRNWSLASLHRDSR